MGAGSTTHVSPTKPTARATPRGRARDQPAGGRPSARAGATPHAHLRARAFPPRRRRVAAGRPAGDADRHPLRRHRQAEEDARVNQPVRVDDRVRAPFIAQRQSTGKTGRCVCAGPPPGCKKPSSSSDASSATPTSPSTPFAVERELTLPQPNHVQTEGPLSSPQRSHLSRTATQVPHRPGDPQGREADAVFDDALSSDAYGARRGVHLAVDAI